MPFLRPSRYHRPSARTAEMADNARQNQKLKCPRPAKAPAPSKNGVAGKGSPTCSAKTNAGSTTYPCRSKNSSVPCIPPSCSPVIFRPGRRFFQEPVYFANSAVCPHSPLMTNSRIRFLLRGAFSLLCSGSGREAASPGYPIAIAAIGSQPCGMSYASLAVSGSNPAIWCTTSPLAVASIESCRLAAPTSYCALRFGALFFANASCATAIPSTGAFFAQFALNSTSAPSYFSNFSASSFVATIYAHGCSLLLDGAHRAASNRLRSTSCGTALSLNARGLQRFWISSCTGNSTGAGWLICVLQWEDRLRYFAACFTISRSIVIATVSLTTTPPPSRFAFHFTPKSCRFT